MCDAFTLVQDRFLVQSSTMRLGLGPTLSAPRSAFPVPGLRALVSAGACDEMTAECLAEMASGEIEMVGREFL
jgi:hypothetical protein